MKGFMAKGGPALALALLCLGGGCVPYKNLVDPCYPERYWASSRSLVNEAFAPQVNNGHVLDQTVWNEYFEPGTDRLNAMGLQKLSYLARRRPQADPAVFLQTAQDLPFDQSNPGQLAALRVDLDAKRKAAVEGFLTAQAANRGVPWNVQIHDPGEVGLAGVPASQAIGQMYYTRFRGGLDGGAGGGSAGAVGGGGAGAVSGGTGGGASSGGTGGGPNGGR